MGLMHFRWKLLLAGIALLLLWQTSKLWLILGGGPGIKVQPQEEESQKSLSLPDDKNVETVHVAVYYEALCPDSRNFFIKQLLPAYQRIPDSLELALVPYGKATTVKNGDDYNFVCQHGPIECEANIIHACSIDVIKDPLTQLEYLTCMIKNNIEPRSVMSSCAEKMNIDSSLILDCYTGKRGKELLAQYGEKTEALSPRVVFIPTITIDGSSQNQPQILKNLLREVCLHFKVIPKGCIS